MIWPAFTYPAPICTFCAYAPPQHRVLSCLISALSLALNVLAARCWQSMDLCAEGLCEDLLYLTLKEEILYDLLGTLRGLTGGDRRLYLPSGVMNQVYDTKNRVIKA